MKTSKTLKPLHDVDLRAAGGLGRPEGREIGDALRRRLWDIPRPACTGRNPDLRFEKAVGEGVVGQCVHQAGVVLVRRTAFRGTRLMESCEDQRAAADSDLGGVEAGQLVRAG